MVPELRIRTGACLESLIAALPRGSSLATVALNLGSVKLEFGIEFGRTHETYYSPQNIVEHSDVVPTKISITHTKSNYYRKNCKNFKKF